MGEHQFAPAGILYRCFEWVAGGGNTGGAARKVSARGLKHGIQTQQGIVQLGEAGHIKVW